MARRNSRNDLVGLTALGLGMMMSKSKGDAGADKNLSGMGSIPASNANTVGLSKPNPVVTPEMVADRADNAKLEAQMQRVQDDARDMESSSRPNPITQNNSQKNLKVKSLPTGAFDQGGGKTVLDAMRNNSVTDTGDETARLAARYPAPKGITTNNNVEKSNDPRETLQYKMANEAVRTRMRNAAGVSEFKKGGAVKKMASGGSVSSASRRADGIAQRGKTRGKYC